MALFIIHCWIKPNIQKGKPPKPPSLSLPSAPRTHVATGCRQHTHMLAVHAAVKTPMPPSPRLLTPQRAHASVGRSGTNTHTRVARTDAAVHRRRCHVAYAAVFFWTTARLHACALARHNRKHTRKLPIPTPPDATAAGKGSTPPVFAAAANVALAHTNAAPRRCTLPFLLFWRCQCGPRLHQRLRTQSPTPSPTPPFLLTRHADAAPRCRPCHRSC